MLQHPMPFRAVANDKTVLKRLGCFTQSLELAQLQLKLRCYQLAAGAHFCEVQGRHAPRAEKLANENISASDCKASGFVFYSGKA